MYDLEMENNLTQTRNRKGHVDGAFQEGGGGYPENCFRVCV